MGIKAVIIDFSRVLIFANAEDPIVSLNRHHAERAATPGYRVLEHFTLNDELLRYLRTPPFSHPIFLLTDGHLHTLPEIVPQLAGIFKATFTAEEIGYKKSQSEAFIEVAYRIGRIPQELLVIDDQVQNTAAAAAAAGCQTLLYASNEQTIQQLNQLA